MIDVRPWFDFPRPIPSCQPIFWSNLLPTLSDPIPDFVGSSYEVEATSSLVLRYFSCKHYHHHMWSNTLLCVLNGQLHKFGALMVTKFNKIFSGWQPCQGLQIHQQYREWIHLREVGVPEPNDTAMVLSPQILDWRLWKEQQYNCWWGEKWEVT